MNKQDQSIYQSGQNVLIDGEYEAVGATVQIVSPLVTGERFPNYDGRAVCWHLVKTQPVSQEEKRSTKFTRPDTFYGGMYS